jgi:Zn-dependent protease with chaperone function
LRIRTFQIATFILQLLLVLAHATHAATPPVILPTASPRVLHYEHLQYIVGFGGLFYSFAILWAILEFRLASKLRQLAERYSKQPILTLALTLILLTTVTFFLNVPLSFYGGYILPHEFGQSTESIGLWLHDVFIGHFVNLGIYFLVFVGLFFVISRSPKKWPLWCWLASVPIIAFSIFAQPLIIDPLFDHFKPMAASPLKTKIEALETKAGITNAPIYVVDISAKTNDVNAYVNGIGGSARIVIWDTTINKLPQDEVLAMVGHEMGHYVLHHVYRGFLETLVIMAALIPLYRLLLLKAISKRGAKWGLSGLTDPAAIPLFLLVLNIFMLVLSPVSSALSRQVESEADAFGIRVTGNPIAMARMFVDIAKLDLSNPDPPAIIQFMYGDHPTLRERVNSALAAVPRE